MNCPKLPFKTKKLARRHARIERTKSGRRYADYKCGKCGQYHLTSKVRPTRRI